MSLNLNQLNFVCQNIRSMRRNTDRLFSYLDSVKEKPLIIGLSEIWISDEEIDSYRITGYNLFVNGNTTNRSGGVAIYARSNLKCKQYKYDFQTFNALGISFTLSGKILYIVCIYRFNYISLSEFIDEFMLLLGNLSYTNLIIMGDFNLDFLQTSPLLEKFLLLLSNNGLDILVSEPTRITNISATCIDNVLFRLDHRYFEQMVCSVLDLKITDHCLIKIKLSGYQVFTNPTRKVFEVPQIDYVKLRELLTSEYWEVVYNCTDASKAFDYFNLIFCDHLNTCTRRTSTSKSRKLKTWMSDKLLKLLRQRNKFCKLAKQHPMDQRLKAYSLKLSDAVNLKITATKKQYYKQLFYQNGKDARKNWNTVNEIIAAHSDVSDIKEIIDQSGGTITDSVAIANEFNKFFIDVGGLNCHGGNMPVLTNDHLTFANSNTTNSFYFTPITSSEVYYIINSLKNKSSPGIDGVKNSIVKQMSCLLVDVLSYIFNLSVDSGVFPSALKRAVVIPIFKKNDILILNNYRPISLLSVFSKILEKAMKNRMVSFLDRNNFFSNSQFGFRKNLNTEKALLSYLDYVTASIDTGLSVSTLFVDMTKAFDRVEHSILLRKLRQCGFRGTTRMWLCSYLKNRAQRVKVNGEFSNELPIKIGVPQGSVLGPLLFLIYINGIFSQHFHGCITAFADDISFTYANPAFGTNNTSIERDLDLLSIWLKGHNLLLSDKTKLLHFRNSRLFSASINYHAYGCNKILPCTSASCFPIEQVKEFRYLGVLIDDNLNWKPQIDNLKSKLLLVARKIYALRLFCPDYLLRMVYFALVNSTLQYGLSCWGSACNTTINSIYIRQKHIIRIMCFKDMLSPSWPIFQTLDILPLQHMFVFKVLRLFFIMSGNNFVDYADYNLRANFQFKKKIPKTKLDLRRSYFSVISAIMFNKLPLNIRMSSSLSIFSKTLLDWLKQNKDINKLFP